MAPPDGFRTGDEVEVSSDEDGFRGAYFEARVVRSMPKIRRYTVDYDAIVDESDRSRRLRETVDARHVRPRPPRHLGATTLGLLTLHQPVDAFYNDAWWVGVVSVAPKGRQTRYRVCFPASREEIEFGADRLRAHLEWIDEQWVLPNPPAPHETPYGPGTQVEVARLKESSPVAWFSALVVKTIWKSYVLVEYINLKNVGDKRLLREIVDLQHIRPRPLCVPVVKFDQHAEVEAFYGNGWWLGVITKVNDNSCYSVKSIHWGKEKEFNLTRLRHHYELVNGQWVQKPQTLPSMDIGEGKVVEVSSDEEGFSGAWFAATVLKLIGKDKFLIQYRNLKTEDETELLTETVDLPHIRPTPPEFPAIDRFRFLEEVDAFYNDGWWVGVITKVLENGRYVVYFRSWKEEIEFGHDNLRPHQDWIEGRWVRFSQKLLASVRC
ncbi:protein AGENET DOMAIN (AGD)-CONTAINING P1-like [Zingiber officinale]|uniref:protein AGENET DOMAIN (AGD)-CONTAINING P1-like n=1 Tax=Zingiber officinale TaxID=94328 RepID=UPI001C4CFAC4|nr:protein AGENET DOMAIN (AGD)-CONTAINING P1-like [Zingiber officinale]